MDLSKFIQANGKNQDNQLTTPQQIATKTKQVQIKERNFVVTKPSLSRLTKDY